MPARSAGYRLPSPETARSEPASRSVLTIVPTTHPRLLQKTQKTRVTIAAEGFDFLGFCFQRRHSRKHGRDVTHVFPTPQACKRVRQRVPTVLAQGQGRGESLGQMVEQVNYGLRGWVNYYAHTHASQAFDKLQAYTNRRLRRHLRRRRQKSGLGRSKEMPDRVLDSPWILWRLHRLEGRMESWHTT